MTRLVELFAFSHDLRQVVLVRKAADCKFVFLRNKWCGVGGHQEAGETEIEAAVREFHEETGISTSYEQWFESSTRVTPAGHLTAFWTVLPRGANPVNNEGKGEVVKFQSIAATMELYHGSTKAWFGPGLVEDLTKAHADCLAFKSGVGSADVHVDGGDHRGGQRADDGDRDAH